MEFILNPPLPISIDEFYKTLLSVSGVLFGIAFAAMLFVLQSGFTSFKFSRGMFLELYLHYGSQLLYSLAYLTSAPFLILYFPDSTLLISWLYPVYFIYFLKSSLDYAKEEGYILTIHSHKFVPRTYGNFRSYFRYIKNRGFLRNLIYLLPIFLLLIYPYVISLHEKTSLQLSQTAVFYTCLIPLLYTLYKITKFIPEFFKYTSMEMSNITSNAELEKTEEEIQRNKNEKLVLKEYLTKHGIKELSSQTPYEFIDGKLSISLIENGETDEVWFNIFVNVKNASPQNIRTEVIRYAQKFAKLLHSSKVEINTFVLSFHIEIETQSSRNIFFRFTRNELDKLFSSSNELKDIDKLKNVLFDELFR